MKLCGGMWGCGSCVVLNWDGPRCSLPLALQTALLVLALVVAWTLQVTLFGCLEEHRHGGSGFDHPCGWQIFGTLPTFAPVVLSATAVPQICCCWQPRTMVKSETPAPLVVGAPVAGA